jgi:hypothetical protein
MNGKHLLHVTYLESPSTAWITVVANVYTTEVQNHKCLVMSNVMTRENDKTLKRAVCNVFSKEYIPRINDSIITYLFTIYL